MATSEQKMPNLDDLCLVDYSDTETDDCSDIDYDSDDSESDPSYDIRLEKTHSKFSDLSIEKKQPRPRVVQHQVGISGVTEAEKTDLFDENDEKTYEMVKRFIRDGQLGKLKVDQCKVYLRKNGLRRTGNKDTLIQRIKEHCELINDGGEKKYPAHSFVFNCKGDTCKGDVVLFEQNVYEKFNLASRSASGPPLGKRTVAGRIVHESYGAAKQQHTFTIEVLWSKGKRPLPPLHPLLIKGRNLYRLKTMRQRWEDEGERLKILKEKHSRGFHARSDREARMHEREKRKILKGERKPKKEEAKKNQPLPCPKLRASISQPGPDHNHNLVDHRHRGSDSSNQTSRGFREIWTNFHFNNQQGATDVYSRFTRQHLCAERTNYIQPPTRVTYPAPLIPRRDDCMQKQLCRYFSQGRCYYGENCKYSHELR